MSIGFNVIFLCLELSNLCLGIYFYFLFIEGYCFNFSFNFIIGICSLYSVIFAMVGRIWNIFRLIFEKAKIWVLELFVKIGILIGIIVVVKEI